MLRYLHPEGAGKMLKERGVEVRTGHIRPDCAWEPGRNISKTFDPQRLFLLQLAGEQKALFEELIAMGFEAAAMTTRYFCLNGEDFLPQRVFCEMFGYSPRTNHNISAYINAVLYYLDPGFPANDRSKQMAANLKRKVEPLRLSIRSEEDRIRIAAELGLPRLPAKFPLARMDTLKQIIAARHAGQLDRLKADHENGWRAVTLRFGIAEDHASNYRTLDEVGTLMNGVTRERARQLEERGLALLGISVD